MPVPETGRSAVQQFFPSLYHERLRPRKQRHTTHHQDIPASVTIIREGHAFEGRSLAVLHSIRRRGIRLVLAVLPDGSRSLIPVDWTDWNGERSKRPATADAIRSAPVLGSLSDLLHLRRVVDALHGRPIESAPCKESCHADASGLSRSDRSATIPIHDNPLRDSLGSTRRSIPPGSIGDPCTSHRPDDRRRPRKRDK